MAKKRSKPKAPPDEDAEQSKRFLEFAKELDAAGDLNAAEAGEAFERLARRILTPKQPAGN